MKFAKTIERDTKERDAFIVNELSRRNDLMPTETWNKKLADAESWFLQKHGSHWQEHLKEADIKQEERSI